MGNTSRILQHLYSLNTSSPDFLRYLHALIQYDEEERYLTNLKDFELIRLLGFLGGVRAVLSTLASLETYFYRPSMRSRQATILLKSVQKS